jgi:hypothetical protein
MNLVATLAQDAPPCRRDLRPANDAFSFWKPPEDWRAIVGPTDLVCSELISDWYLLERYRGAKAEAQRLKINLYYAVKDFIPAGVRCLIRSLAVRLQRRRAFPNWPSEDALLLFQRDWILRAMELSAARQAWHIGFWPRDYSCCVVLTHDVESPAGFERMEVMAELEERFGFRSAWNLPLDQYPIDWRRVQRLRRRGFEFGAHGLRHDGMLFRSRLHFLDLAPRVQALAFEHGLRGFRSPSTLRNARWLGEMDFDHDSSFADTDPFEPQPGGSCSIFPYFIGGLVELPYTLAQDHTLINLLRRDPVPIWMDKVNWLAARGAMILALTHPDYSAAGRGLYAYSELLRRLADLPAAWRALPSEVSAWWRQRAGLRLETSGGRPQIAGPYAHRAAARPLCTQPLLAWS